MKKFLLICLLFVCGLASAQIPKAKKNTFVNDYANLLTADDIKSLNQKLYVIQKQAGVQVAIVLVKKVPSEFTIERFATRIGRKWHVGTKKRGIVYVAAIDDHLQRLAIADSLQTTFTDEKCEDILAEMKPSYRNDDYNGGLTTLVNSIHTELIGPIATPAPVAKPVVAQQAAVTSASKQQGIPDYVKYGGFIIIIFFIFRLATKKSGNNMDGNYRQRGNYGGGSVINNYNGGGRWYRRPYGSWGSNRRDSYSSGSYSSTNEPSRVSEDNNSDNWGNWGSGDSGDSGFSDNDSSSSRRSSSSSSSSRSSSSDSSGFSDRGGSSGSSSGSSSSSSGGSTSSW